MALNSTSIPHSSGPGSPGGSAGTGGGCPGGPGAFKEDLDDFERFALENLVRNEWGLKVATLNRLMCKCDFNQQCRQVLVSSSGEFYQRECGVRTRITEALALSRR